MYLATQLINGACQGLIYALMAIGYSMIVGVTGLVTFTYGEVAMIGAFSAFYSFMYFGNNLVLAILAGFLGAGVAGFVIHKVCYARFLESPKYISLICTIGMSMLFKNLAQIVFGTQIRPMPEGVGRRIIELGPLRFSSIQILILVVVAILSVSLTLFLNKTRAGMALRSVSQDRRAAAIIGVDVEKTTMLGNMVGCALGGAGGVLLGLYYTTIVATMGGVIGLKAFSAAVLGGLTNISLAALGGFLIGVFENIGISFVPTGLRDAIAFGFLIIVLLIKPQGLSGKKGGTKI
jgi:branched-chain amino acid transport system permease protein